MTDKEKISYLMAQVEILRSEIMTPGILIPDEPIYGGDSSYTPPEVISVYCGYKHHKEWMRSDWTGSATPYLKIPEDGTTEPSYISKSEYESATEDNAYDVLNLISFDGMHYYTRDDGVRDGVIFAQMSDVVKDGWVLCDGTNGTPDLRSKFICGYGDDALGWSPGAEKYTITAGSISTTLNIDPPPGFVQDPLVGGYDQYATNDADIDIPTIPPFVPVYFIMRKRGFEHS